MFPFSVTDKVQGQVDIMVVVVVVVTGIIITITNNLHNSSNISYRVNLVHQEVADTLMGKGRGHRHNRIRGKVVTKDDRARGGVVHMGTTHLPLTPVITSPQY